MILLFLDSKQKTNFSTDAFRKKKAAEMMIKTYNILKSLI